jgi:DNA mismatch endonuclease (patch repair protein)
MGFRFRLHVSSLPGKPDIVLPRHRKAIFVHGCFWHGHDGCPRSKRPVTNEDFWNVKIGANIRRDVIVLQELSNAGWDVLVVWGCEIKKRESLIEKLHYFITGKES